MPLNTNVLSHNFSIRLFSYIEYSPFEGWPSLFFDLSCFFLANEEESAKMVRLEIPFEIKQMRHYLVAHSITIFYPKVISVFKNPCCLQGKEYSSMLKWQHKGSNQASAQNG